MDLKCERNEDSESSECLGESGVADEVWFSCWCMGSMARAGCTAVVWMKISFSSPPEKKDFCVFSSFPRNPKTANPCSYSHACLEAQKDVLARQLARQGEQKSL